MNKFESVRIGDIGDVVTGKTPETNDRENYANDYMFIGPADLHKHFFIKSSEKMISEKGLKSIKGSILQGTSVLVGCIGWDMGNVGIVEATCATNQQINTVTNIKKQYNPLYIYYWLKNKKEFLRQQASVTRTPILNKSSFSDIKINIPNDKTDQDKVADLLRLIDNKIDINMRINSEFEEMARTLYDYWFVQFDFPDENGKPYKSSGGAMQYSSSLKRDIPAGWHVVTLADLLKKNTEKYRFDNQVDFALDLSVMPSGTMCLNERSYSSKFGTNLFYMKKYDLLFGSIRPYLRKSGFAPFEGVVTGTVHSYRPKKDSDYNFTCLTLTSPSLFTHAIANCKGTKMPVIGSDELLSYKVAYDESVATKFNLLFSFREVISANISENYILAELRDWLLPMLMNGQVKVEDRRNTNAGDADKKINLAG